MEETAASLVGLWGGFGSNASALDNAKKYSDQKFKY